MTQLYQRRRLSPAEDLGAPAPLPRELAGLSNASLADLSAWSPEYAAQLGWAGEGFFPFTPPPSPPPPVDELNKIDFYRLFTSAERIAIRAAGGTNPLIADYQDMLDATPRPRLSDPDLQTGVQLLELGGLLGVGRAAQILAGERP
jgi:hypothetical protein